MGVGSISVQGKSMERVTENVYTITDIKGCNPSYVVTSEGVLEA